MIHHFRATDAEVLVKIEGTELLEPYVARVELAANEAEQAADNASAAALTVGVFPSTAAGIAATANGDFFYVTGDGALLVYNNIATVATLRYTLTESTVYLPPQANLVGSLAVGTGLRNISHTTGDTGQANIAFGIGALDDLTTGRLNIAIGYLTGKDMTSLATVNTYGGVNGNAGNVLIGGYVAAVANGLYDSTLIGTQCGLNATTGMDLVGVGINCLKNIEAAGETVGVGHAVFEYLIGVGSIADIDNTTTTPGAGYSWGHRMSGFGDQAGRFLNDGATQKTSGKKSVYIGALTRSSTNFAINENVFGYAALGKGSNTFSFGSTAVTGHYFNSGDLYIVAAPATAAFAGNLYRDPADGKIKTGTGPAFAAWTPTFTASSGTFTAVTVNGARWTQHGKIVHFNTEFTIPTSGTGTASGSIILSLPTNAAYPFCSAGFEYNATGAMLRVSGCNSSGFLGGTLSHAVVVEQAAAGNIIADGRKYIVSGTYEAV